MLPKDDGGVVDPELRVYGTANVRVVSSNLAFRNVFVDSTASNRLMPRYYP